MKYGEHTGSLQKESHENLMLAAIFHMLKSRDVSHMYPRNDPSIRCSRADLVAIIEKSAFLRERLAPDFVSKHSDEKSDEPLEVYEKWRKRVADGDEKRFQRRLAWDGLDSARAKELISGVRLTDPTRLPAWAHIVEEVVNNTPSRSEQELDVLEAAVPVLGPGAPPFAHLMVGFLDYAVDQLRYRAGHGWDLLGSTAKRSLQLQLLKRLCSFAQATLMMEFEVFRTLKRATWALPSFQSDADDGRPSRILYSHFVQSLLSQGLINLFREYPVLARLLAELTLQWINSTTEFLQRLSADQSEIALMLAGQNTPTGVANIVTDLSDPHGGGRTVLEVQFESGYSCMYKPRNVNCESAYYELLMWLNAQGLALPFATFQGIYRPNYGWVEIVRPEPCSDGSEVERYYLRAGMLLCLIFMLEGCDCHAENLVGHRDFPALIDMEALFQPRIAACDLGGAADAMTLAGQVFFSESVFRVGLLPRWVAKQGGSHSIGGLAIGAPEPAKARTRCLNMINSDRMGWRVVELSVNHGTPRSPGAPAADPQDYVDQIVDGFKSMYDFFQVHAADIYHITHGCVRFFAGLSSRFLFRSTANYVNLQQAAFQPLFLRDGLLVSIHLDGLCKRFLEAEQAPPAWKIVKAEQEMLLAGDIPLFLADISDGTVRSVDDCRSPLLQLRPAMEAVESHIGSLTQAELELQSAYIRSAFTQLPNYKTTTVADSEIHSVSLDRELTSNQFLDEAVRIAEKIRTNAITSNGTATWITRAYDPDSQAWQMQPMTLRLYDGVCGPALFLAALEHVAPGSGFRKLSRAAYQSVLENFRRGTRQFGLDELGAGLGLGSVIYSLVTGGLLLDSEDLIDGAVDLARQVTADRIGTDRFFDLLRGCAGAAICLNVLYRVRPAQQILDLMAACGEYLLGAQKRGHRGGAAWETVNGKMLCGFSHGAAGVAFALHQLADRTCHSPYAEAALAAEDYEDSLFSLETGNWPDLLSSDISNPQFRDAWCHGAAGILLGRLYTTDGNRLNQFVERALQTVVQEPLGYLDHLCCGNLGRSEVLLEAGLQLSRPHLVEEARRRAARVVQRSRQQHHYQLGVPAGIDLASFHQGLAGIGYNLLRFAFPGSIPCVLAWR